MAEMRVSYRGLVGKREGKRPSGIPRRRWKDNIKLDLKIGCQYLDGIDVTHDGDSASFCEHGNEIVGSLKCRESLTS
jgi:hypothetical protein